MIMAKIRKNKKAPIDGVAADRSAMQSKAAYTSLAGTKWSLRRPAVLWAPSFLAAGVDLLASPELTRMADELSWPEVAETARWLRYRDAFQSWLTDAEGCHCNPSARVDRSLPSCPADAQPDAPREMLDEC